VNVSAPTTSTSTTDQIVVNIRDYDSGLHYNAIMDIPTRELLVENNIFDSNQINKSSASGIYIDCVDSNTCNHNLFKNTNMTNIAGTSVYLSDDGSGQAVNNTFLNFSYNNESVTNAQLIRKWYYRAHVNDTSGNLVSGANITAYNITGNYNFNLTTDATGYTAQTGIIDYVNNGTLKMYYSNYIIYADNVTHSINHNYNVSYELNNLMDIFSLSLVDLIPSQHKYNFPTK